MTFNNIYINEQIKLSGPKIAMLPLSKVDSSLKANLDYKRLN